MRTPLWSKGYTTDDFVDRYTVGDDRALDLRLAAHDIAGSRAHAAMLAEAGLISGEDAAKLTGALDALADEVAAGEFAIGPEHEDIHSKLEHELVARVGEAGKRIHTARSRNDQVLTALHLFAGEELAGLDAELGALFARLLALAEEHAALPLPGYTHLQVAMPSSFGLFFGGYAEAFVDDRTLVTAARRIADQNPLGSGAGYGSGFPIDRARTTELMGLARTRVVATSAQLSRGKLEWTVAMACAGVCATLSRLAADMCLYMSENYGFVRFPRELTTGSSIMPHKRNPDVWEVMRARCALVLAAPAQAATLLAGLPSGYHRDLQETKGLLVDALDRTREALRAAAFMLRHVEPATGITDDPRYDLLFTVEEVTRRVTAGETFRDAYRAVGEAVEDGSYRARRELDHTHLGSLGRLGLDEVRRKWAAEDYRRQE